MKKLIGKMRDTKGKDVVVGEEEQSMIDTIAKQLGGDGEVDSIDLGNGRRIDFIEEDAPRIISVPLHVGYGVGELMDIYHLEEREAFLLKRSLEEVCVTVNLDTMEVINEG